MYESELDPVSKTFRPLLIDAPLVDRHPPSASAPPLTVFDRALGARLSMLLAQPLSKPPLLRKFALGATLGLVLKVLGGGRPEGKPMLLALAIEDDGSKPLRDAAVISFRAGVSALDRRIAAMMAEHPLAPEISKAPKGDGEVAEVRGGLPPAEAMLELIAAIRRGAGEDAGDVYWPDLFATAFGRRAGCVLPKMDKAGWGVHLALPGEFVEMLVLMSVPPGAPPIPWRELWRGLRKDLGLVIGASAAADAEALRAAGVEGASLERLSENASVALDFGVRLGVARRLPDSGAEVGGGL
jgi:hypothetical protein